MKSILFIYVLTVVFVINTESTIYDKCRLVKELKRNNFPKQQLAECKYLRNITKRTKSLYFSIFILFQVKSFL